MVDNGTATFHGIKKKKTRGAEIIFIDGYRIGCDPKLSVKITGRTRCSQPSETWRLRNFEFRVTQGRCSLVKGR